MVPDLEYPPAGSSCCSSSSESDRPQCRARAWDGCSGRAAALEIESMTGRLVESDGAAAG